MTPQQQSALFVADAALVALAEAHRVLRASLEPVDPAAIPKIHTQRLNLASVVCFDSWHASSRYERFQRLVRWTGNRAQVRIIGINLVNGGGANTLGSARYTLLIDGVERASAAPSGSAAVFDVPLAELSTGWHELDLAGLAPGETCPKWFAYLHRPGAPAPDLMPVCTGSYELTHAPYPPHSWAWVPTRYTPKAAPLAPRAYPPVTDPRAVHWSQLVPGDGANINRPNVSAEGIWNTFNQQAYDWLLLIDKLPKLALLDGPRGVGTCSMVTHISIGTGRFEDRPDSPLMLNIYATDPWRVFRVGDDGTIKTLAGYRHKGPGGHWKDDKANLELVGDWSAIPEARRGFHELWGLAWDSSTLVVDASAAPIPEEQGRKPHVGNPACVVSDSQNNRLCRIEFDGRSHATPAKVTEFAVNLADPWDVVEWRDEFIVSEQSADRIIALDKAGKFKRVVLQRDPANPARSGNTWTRKAFAVGAQAQVMAQPCIAPTGLFVLDDWLYWGSLLQGQVRRVHLVTGATDVACSARTDANSRFVKVAVSDGTFGPRGTVFACSWSNSGVPEHGGTKSDGAFWQMQRPLPAWATTSYRTAVAVGGGRMYVASAQEGITRISARLPGDVVGDEALYVAGRAEYEARTLRLLHGVAGHSPYGFAAPAGSAALKHYLQLNGQAA